MYFLQLSMQVCGGFFLFVLFFHEGAVLALCVACVPQETKGQNKPCLSKNEPFACRIGGEGISHKAPSTLSSWTCFWNILLQKECLS